jgi:hypothetical protein
VRIGIGAADLQRPFNGGVDEVRLSRGARYLGDFVRPSAPLAVDSDTVALWHLDDGPGQTALDATGAHSGWLGAMSTAADPSDPTWGPADCIENR